ncbi:MAG: DUF418 domain-containing protein [Kineosporiaceae bacterium]
MSTDAAAPTPPPARVAPVGPTKHSERSLAPDLARGSVLLFIALANVSVYHYGRELGLGYRPADGSGLDRTLNFLVAMLIDARSYPMFAMLFGYGMVKVLDRQLRAGRTVGAAQRLLVRRNLWLLAFGAVHATLLFLGDILGPYAVTGLLALLFITLRTRILAWIAGVSLVPLTLAFGLSRLLASDEGLLSTDDYLLSMAIRFGVWVSNLVFIGGFFGLMAPVLIGVLLARSGLLDRPWEHVRRLSRYAVAGIGLGAVGGLPYALQVAAWWDAPLGLSVLTASLHALTGVAAGFGYICLFGLVAAALRGRGAPGPLRPLAATGERSLTAYLLQSVALAPLMSPWGLGLGGEISSAQAYALAAGVWLATVVIATGLAAAGNRGPFEILLRRLMYGRPRPAAPVIGPPAASPTTPPVGDATPVTRSGPSATPPVG